MSEEIKNDNNCIIKAFENNPISILEENINNKKIYCFKSSDIGKALKLSNIAVSIQHYDEDERVIRKAYDTTNRLQDTVYLTSQGVYRLLYNSKKPIAKQFRKWAGNILDDIIFNESIELKKQLENKDKLIEDKQKELEFTQQQLQTVNKLQINKIYNKEKKDVVYAYKNKEDNKIKIGKTKNLGKRELSYMVGNRNFEIFYSKRCYKCELTERVIQHILDKPRIHSNKEWFDITEEFAIYIIDIACNFLDGFINTSEYLLESNFKDYLSDLQDSFNELIIKEEIEEIKEEIIEKENTKENTQEKLNIKIQETQLHFNKFVNDFCIYDKESKTLKSDLLGAYRFWNKGLTFQKNNSSISMLTGFCNTKFKIHKEYMIDNHSYIIYYTGIKLKNLIPQKEEIIEQKYEKFILDEYKFDYTYRSGKTDIMLFYNEWLNKNYPDYILTKDEKIHFESYLSKNFFYCKKIHIKGGTTGYYGLQLKSDDAQKTYVYMSKMKPIIQINANTQEVIREFQSLIEASNELNIGKSQLSNLVKREVKMDDFDFSYILKYKKIQTK